MSCVLPPCRGFSRKRPEYGLAPLARSGGRDFARIAQEFEVHGVLQFVVAEPIEAVFFERADPTLGHGHALPIGLLAATFRVAAPGFDAVAARVVVRIDVQSD